MVPPLRIKFCEDCDPADENCPTCGEPVRSIWTALIAIPICDHCGTKTAAYYAPGIGSTTDNAMRGATWWIYCPRYFDDRGLFSSDRATDHEHRIISVGRQELEQRIAIRLRSASLEWQKRNDEA